MSDGIELLKAPELVFGLVAPIGVDLNRVTDALTHALLEVEYDSQEIRVTEIMQAVATGRTIPPGSYIESYRAKIAFANDVRAKLGDGALAALAISAIRTLRLEHWEQALSPDDVAAAEPAEEPVPSRAYIVRQFKRPEEVDLMRSVYGRQFIVISAYAPRDVRRETIRDKHRQSLGGVITEVEANAAADQLIKQDANEESTTHG